MSAKNGSMHAPASNGTAQTLESNGSQPAEERSGYKPTTEPIWLGVPSPKPKSRALGATLFGHIDDAFDSKSIKIGEETPFARRERLKEEARSLKELEDKEEERKIKEEEEEERKRKEAEEMEKAEKENQAKKSEDIKSGIIITEEDEKDLPKMLIRGGRIVNDDQSFEADVYVVGNKIRLVGESLQVPDDVKTIDAKNCLIMPGGIDTNTQFSTSRLGVQSVDDFRQGTKAAVSGGTTTIIDCVPIHELASQAEDESASGASDAGGKLLESFENRRQAADNCVCCDYSLCVEISVWNESVEKAMDVLSKEKGVNCFRVNPASLSDSSLYQFFKKCGQLGAIAQVIPKSSSLNKQISDEIYKKGITGPEGYLLSHPEELEALAVNRAISLADQANAAVYIGSVTGKTAAELVSRYRRKGRTVFGEVCSAALVQSSMSSPYEDNRWIYAASHVTEPPLRPNTSNCLINHLSVDGLQVIASTHCAFSAKQKAMGKDDFRLIPPGINGVAERLAVVWNQAVINGGMDPCRFVSVTSSDAAKIFNLYPLKGRIAAGSDADLIVWDPEGTTEIIVGGHQSSSDLNIYDGLSLKGSLRNVISAGTIVLDPENGLTVSERQGHFIPASCNAEYVYGRLHSRNLAAQYQMTPVIRDMENLNISSKSSENQKTSIGDQRSAGKVKDMSPDDEHVNKYHCRPATSSGGRNMQDTTFSLSGTSYCARLDDKPGKKGCGYKVNQPPGGSTTQLW